MNILGFRHRKLLSSSIRRALRWEFWPMWVFYPPVIIWIVLLAIRYRGLKQLTLVNPAMPTGGLIDSNKASNLLAIQKLKPDSVALTALIPANAADQLILIEKQIQSLGIDYPIILKPNGGQRGLGVSIVHSHEEAERYFQNHHTDTLIQEFIPGAEFGVFYMREPNAADGFIFSVTHKQFPKLLGDGKSTLEELILNDSRAHFMARYLLDFHASNLKKVLEAGESIQLVDIGSHCRGALFVDGSAYITDALIREIDAISKCIPEYYFGRYDIRVPSIDDLMNGKGIKVIEANGLSSESTNIYDPRNSIFSAYKTVFKQWDMAYIIARQNGRRGFTPSPYSEVYQHCINMNK